MLHFSVYADTVIILEFHKNYKNVIRKMFVEWEHTGEMYDFTV